MKRSTTVAAIAPGIYTISWLMPVVKDGTTLAEGGVPGWEAFRVALSPVWRYGQFSGGTWLSDIISVTSALTNIWFILALAVLLFWPHRSKPGIFRGLVFASLVNALWFILAEDRGDLRIGYYLWVVSFMTLAVAARLISTDRIVSGSITAAASS